MATASEQHDSVRDQGEITTLLVRARGGDSQAWSDVFALTYTSLKAIAFNRIGSPANGLLSATVVVHEAVLRLLKSETDLENRREYFAVVATAIHRVVIDTIRKRSQQRRGGDAQHVPLTGNEQHQTESDERAVEVLEAIRRLQEVDPGAAHILIMNSCGGLSRRAIAQMTSREENEIVSELRMAKGWIRKEIASMHDEGEAVANRLLT